VGVTVEETSDPTEERLRQSFGEALGEALAPWQRGDDPLTLLFSGGVDSCLLAWELRRRPGLELLTVGRSGAPDLVAGEEAAQKLGLPWRGSVLEDDELERLLTVVGPELDGTAPARRAIFLALAAALSHCAGPIALCGQGVDELFLGYRHFAGLRAAEAAAREQRDLDRLLADDWPRSERIATSLGRRLLAPYLTSAVVRAARSVPIDLRLPGNEPKGIFRRWAVARGLDPALASRPKRALQYGSGIDRWLRRRESAGP
jgi:asparagine synthase (glutamine-hydrolysing)